MEQKVNIAENLTKAIAYRHPDAKAYLKSNLLVTNVNSNDYIMIEAFKNGIGIFEDKELLAKISQIEKSGKVPENLSSLVINVYDFLNEIGEKQKDLGE